jgi:hypothetical protein
MGEQNVCAECHPAVHSPYQYNSSCIGQGMNGCCILFLILSFAFLFSCLRFFSFSFALANVFNNSIALEAFALDFSHWKKSEIQRWKKLWIAHIFVHQRENQFIKLYELFKLSFGSLHPATLRGQSFMCTQNVVAADFHMMKTWHSLHFLTWFHSREKPINNEKYSMRKNVK